MRVSSSQSARSQIPGSRSSQRPCVSAMSSAPGAKTSKTSRPSGAQVPRPRAAPRAGRRRSPCAASSGTGSITSGNVAFDGRVAHVAVAQVELARRRARRARARPRASPPRGRRRRRAMPARRSARRSGPCRRRARAPARRERTRLLDVERHVLDDAARPRVVEARDLVVGGHGAMLSGMTTLATTLFMRPRCSGRGVR